MPNILKNMVQDADRRWDQLLLTTPDKKPATHPDAFAVSYLVGKPIPYLCCNELSRENGAGGVLPAGAVVWLRQTLGLSDRNRQISGWSETTGFLLVNTRELSVLRRR